MEEQLRALVTVGLGLLLVLLRLDAERFGAAEYDESSRGRAPSLPRRLAWYLLGVGLVGTAVVVYPGRGAELGIAFGDRLTAIVGGFLYGGLGIVQAAGFAYLRYDRIRLPDASSYPGALANALLTALVDEATFRGILLGVMLLAGLEPWVACVVQALLYALATRTGAPGRARYMLVLALAIGLFSGWLTIATGTIAAAFIGHAITRFAVFLATGHPGQVAPAGREIEEELRRRLIPEGWRVIGSRESRGASTRDR